MDDEIKAKAPSYTCHKRVQALEIESIGSYRHHGDEWVRLVTFKDPGLGSIDRPEAMFVRYVPEPGDFLVIYEDGYQSFSPRKAFLDGYKKD